MGHRMSGAIGKVGMAAAGHHLKAGDFAELKIALGCRPISQIACRHAMFDPDYLPMI